MADRNYFDLKIISPDRIFYEGKAWMVELTTSEGQIGIYKKHVPLTAMIEPGEIRISEEEGVKVAAIHAGFLEVLPEKITVLAEVVEWPEEIDIHRAEEAKIRAERRIATKDPNINLHRAEIALRRALTRIDVAQKK
ncbi:MAG: ATP synthase F1 subunit epsilon [Lachnospiraceae bacterium]|nr:ATP synthase F1 subunit epsilon [Robinsoniella sp.]MDY3765579.1 ATP synthase F1 subunit epsilon [Lachnospiraceae bacterium]